MLLKSILQHTFQWLNFNQFLLFFSFVPQDHCPQYNFHKLQSFPLPLPAYPPVCISLLSSPSWLFGFSYLIQFDQSLSDLLEVSYAFPNILRLVPVPSAASRPLGRIQSSCLYIYHTTSISLRPQATTPCCCGLISSFRHLSLATPPPYYLPQPSPPTLFSIYLWKKPISP